MRSGVVFSRVILLFLSSGEVIHYGVQAAEVSERPVEQAVGEDALHEADKVRAERNAAVAHVVLDGPDGFAGHGLRLLDLEEGVDAVEHAGIDEVRGDGGYPHGALLAGQLDAQAFAPADGRPLGRRVERHFGQGQHAGR